MIARPLPIVRVGWTSSPGAGRTLDKNHQHNFLSVPSIFSHARPLVGLTISPRNKTIASEMARTHERALVNLTRARAKPTGR